MSLVSYPLFYRFSAPFTDLGILMQDFLNNRQQIVDYIRTNKVNIEFINNNCTKLMLPGALLDWIEDDKRQNNWIINYLFKNQNCKIIGVPELQGRDLVVATIDILNSDLNAKSNIINVMKQNWISHKQGDGFFDWFKEKKDGDVYEIARGFAIKKFPDIYHVKSLYPGQGPSSFSLTNLITDATIYFSNYDELLIFFDNYEFSQAEKQIWLDGVRKKYNQQKYRKNLVDKKQYNFILAKGVIKKLDKLAQQYELSRAEIIELLINMEAATPVHIPNRIRYVKNMTDINGLAIAPNNNI